MICENIEKLEMIDTDGDCCGPGSKGQSEKKPELLGPS